MLEQGTSVGSSGAKVEGASHNDFSSERLRLGERDASACMPLGEKLQVEALFGRPSQAWRYRRWLGDGGEQRLSEFSGELSKPDLEAVEFWGCDAYRLSSRGFDVFPTVNVRRCVRAKGCQLAALETQTVQYGRCCQM